ncbi:hypothetical protein C0Q70_21611 [Pomacea canaliculata]|uniref:Putative 2'-deoxynucleoside 5'-phosphate N-hydrolase 1 n=2 Tax=Pomacea canaliculata TaxID=400727 RepID=A0A2T7ND41_POMCA|nr:hypothetical protein C0Q70_21611 [Pomacea canaliculata]
MSAKRKIFFAGSIGGGRQYQDLYMRIIEQLKLYGNVLSEFVGNPDIDGFLQDLQWTDKQCHEQDVIWLQESDVLVAECTQPSLGVGYEIARSEAMMKKILILFQAESESELPRKIRGLHNDTTFIVKDYREEELPGLLKDFFSKL